MTMYAISIVNTIAVSLILATGSSSGCGVRMTWYYFIPRLATPGTSA
jgi:hypothetical protein